ncbi:hypothetical protein CVO96_06195 [Deinococcus koreensis]|uniref:DinB-like domain-containing protein n=2 Tax=Deinococcus koreensis TaxID=2054903 RepID=A0A2K3V286_9DEIO|nr:hypothetical protein CVO96_06195 [Deinococcus koreensis]
MPAPLPSGSPQVPGTRPDTGPAAALAHELGALEAHLRTRQADWQRPQPGRAWSPAQEAEHVILIGEAGRRAIRLLLSERELRPLPHVPGTLREGRRQAPEFAQPGEAGLAWGELETAWAAHRAALLELAAGVHDRPGRTLWHPFLGEIGAVAWLNSLTAHVRHHRELLEAGARA